MSNRKFVPVLLAGLLATQIAHAQFSIAPLTTFSPNNDGWLAPGEGGYAYLTTGNTERGLAYNPMTGHLYLVSRANVGNGLNIRILDKNTGADLGGLNTTGISGGTFAINMVGVGADGVIYVNNLTLNSGSSPLKVYSWATETSAPSTVYSGDAGLAGARVGDTLAVIGSGSSTRLALGYGSSPSVTGNNGYAIVNPTAGTATAVGFSGTPPNAGDFRLGITFTDANHVWGTQGTTWRYTSFSGSSGTLLSSFTPLSNAERIMAYAVVGPMALLAVQSTGDSHVSIYDVSNPSSPILLGQGNNTSGTLATNTNGTGQAAWGDIAYDSNTQTWSAKLWTMSSNQGIQAFIVTVPEPSSVTLAALGGLALLALFRRRTAK
jgi:hypothetical protein